MSIPVPTEYFFLQFLLNIDRFNNPPNPKYFVHFGLMEKNEIALNNAGNGMESMGALFSHVC